VPEGNSAPAGRSRAIEAGSDMPPTRGNGAQPKERDDTDMDETTAGTVDGAGQVDTSADTVSTDTVGAERSGTNGAPTGGGSPRAESLTGSDPVRDSADPTTASLASDAATADVTRVGDAAPAADVTEAGETEAATATATGGDGGSDEGGGTSDEDGEADARPAKRRRPLRSAVEWVLVIGGALVVALLIRTFLLQAFWIPSASMEPTLQEGDRVLVNKLSYDLHDVHRGDIIVFERPEDPDGAAHPEDDIKDLIKRVVGLPGETIEAREGVVYIDGEPLDESYLPTGTTTDSFPPRDIGEDQVFVMGDNRGNSSDSRVFGPIDQDLIVGRAFIRIYPLDDIGGL
jgi:signal peptidase I